MGIKRGSGQAGLGDSKAILRNIAVRPFPLGVSGGQPLCHMDLRTPRDTALHSVHSSCVLSIMLEWPWDFVLFKYFYT